MNHPFYNQNLYSYPAVFSNQAEPPAPPAPQPGVPAGGYPPQPYPGGGYQAPPPVRPGSTAWVPVPAPACPMPQGAPAFSLKDPRKTGGVRRLNLAAAVVMTQTGLSLVVQLVIMFILAAGGVSLENDSLGLLWLSAAISPLCTALPCLIYMWAGHYDWNEFFRFERPGFLTGLLCVLGGLGMCMAANYPAFLMEDLLKSIGMDPSAGNTPLNPEHSFTGFLLQFAVVAVLVPVMEEFAFRGVLFSSLRRYGLGFAVVGSALVFGMAHLALSNAVFAFIAGLAMSYVYAKTENLWLTVFIHALNNGIAVVEDNAALLVGESGVDALIAYLTFIPLALGALSLVLLIVLRRKKLFGKGRPADQGQAMRPLGAGEALGCCVKSVALWGLFLIVLGCTALLSLL